MRTNSRLAYLAAAAVLSGCGGGAPVPGQLVGASTGNTLEDSRAKALAIAQAATTVAPEEAARQLMDFGEVHFPGFFPSRQATLSYPPFLYRYYPQTGIYLGVVVTDGMGYVYNGVYVAGGPFGGQPQYEGLLSAYITPISPSPGPTAANNGCYDLAAADTQGTHTVVTVQFSGQTGTQTEDDLVGTQTSFEGYQAIETVQTTTTTSAGVASSSELKTYARRTADAEYTTYGRVSVDRRNLTTTTTRIVYSPPWVDKQFALAIGESVTRPWGATTTIIVSVVGQADRTTSTSFAQTVTTKYSGRETVTVPAGTYDTCRFDSTFLSAFGSTNSTGWVIVGKGIPVQYAQGGTIAARATSVKLNGQSL